MGPALTRKDLTTELDRQRATSEVLGVERDRIDDRLTVNNSLTGLRHFSDVPIGKMLRQKMTGVTGCP
jgi:hypothetical protein